MPCAACVLRTCQKRLLPKRAAAASQLKLQLLPTGQPTVLLEVEPRRPGGHRLRLHSGVRLVNATDLHLRIGCVPKPHLLD